MLQVVIRAVVQQDTQLHRKRKLSLNYDMYGAVSKQTRQLRKNTSAGTMKVSAEGALYPIQRVTVDSGYESEANYKYGRVD